MRRERCTCKREAELPVECKKDWKDRWEAKEICTKLRFFSFFHILTSFFVNFSILTVHVAVFFVGVYVCKFTFLAKSICISQHVSVYLFMFAVHPGVTWSRERVRTYLCVCVSVRLQHLSNCSSIRGSALWSGGCAGPQHSLRRVVSHHARLITDAASLLAAWQALPSATNATRLWQLH